MVDGKPVDKPESDITCEEVQLLKKSRIRDFVLNTEIRVHGNRIYEEVRLTAEKATPVARFYHFMHPWTATATEYAAELLDGTRVEGVFDGDGAQEIDKATRWSAIYDRPSGKGAVTCVLSWPEGGDWRTRYWDVAGRYRKHYFVTFEGQTVPAGREFCYRIVTVPFEAGADNWKTEATRVAKSEMR
ncbi:MAG: hypothetical protein GXX96_26445 [Planctomycetaceae bacterium]|nr:hypothetical protein [Planctomycetaceae bacterium]